MKSFFFNTFFSCTDVHAVLKLAPVLAHPHRPRGSQSGWEKGRDERFQVRAKEPLGTDSPSYFQKFKRMPAPDWA